MPVRPSKLLLRVLPVIVLVAAAMTSLAPARAAKAAVPEQFRFRPDIHGDEVVFTSEGDLWLGSIAAHSAARITSDEGTEGPARFSPDGTRIAFTAQYDGGTDVYVSDVTGGLPRRLTWDPTGAVVEGWTADGKNVLFRSARNSGDGRHRLWTVPAEGGSATLLPIPYAEFGSFDPGGTLLAYVPVSAEWQHWKRYRGGQADDIWLADQAAHSFRRLTSDPGIDTAPVWAAGAIYFVSDRDGHANLYRLDPATGAAAAATRYTDYDIAYPGTDGHRVVFEHGSGLALYDPATGRTEELRFDFHSDRIHARQKRVPAMDHLFGVVLGPSGKRMLVSARGQILNAAVEDGDVRVVAADPGTRCQYPAWSPDGKEVAFVSDASGEEEVMVAPAGGGSARQLTRDHHGPLAPLVWSPDGQHIATSDREMRVWLVDTATGAMTLVDQADRAGDYDVVNASYRFSPDGKWLAYARIEPDWNQAVYLYDIAGRRKFPVTSGEMNSTAPTFDAKGKYLYFLSDRGFDGRYINANRYFSFDGYTKVSLVTLSARDLSPFEKPNVEEGPEADTTDAAGATPPEKPARAGRSGKTAKSAPGLPEMHVDPEGLAARVAEVPVPADEYTRVEPVEGRILLEVVSDADEGGGGETPLHELRAYDLKKKDVTTIADSLEGFDLSGNREKLLLLAKKKFTLVDAGTGSPEDDDSTVEVKSDAWTLTVDPAAEWRQIFQETWRIARDFFYDPAMHGVDWAAVRTKYAPMLDAVGDRGELNFVLGQMIAELNCGHAYVGGGDEAEGSTVAMGYLGADLEPVAGEVPAYRVTRLYPGDGFDLEARSPLLAPGIGVKPGDCILAVAGRPVRADEDIQSLLAGTAGQPTALTVNDKPSLRGSREVLVKPLAGEGAARYYDWVEGRREYVRTHGGENLGYLHLPDMDQRGLGEFAKHYYPNLSRDGMIYDVRHNGGGYIDGMLLLQMSSHPYSWFKPRYGASWTRQDWAFAGYSAALCDDESCSDAEEFCDAFQRLHLGPVIGTRSWGGEVGSGGGYALVDGGRLCIPNYGEWVPQDKGGRWVIEGEGVIPDMIVDQDPAALLAGRDPQLDRAIEVLKAKIAAAPVARPEPPPFPVKAGMNKSN